MTYQKLETKIKGLTLQKYKSYINAAMQKVEQGQKLDTALKLSGMCPDEHKKFLILKHKDYTNKQNYFANAYKIADAKREEMLVNTLLNDIKTSAQQKSYELFLEKYNNFWGDKARKELNYNLLIILTTAKKYLKQEDYFNFLEDIKCIEEGLNLEKLDGMTLDF